MIGSTVGNYRIVERLGDGGMGSVFRAVDEMLDREVAIKVLRPELARQEALVERFRQEARALARLSHPRIATLHGMERHGDELLMIMEFVRGDTLEAIVQRSGRIGWQRAAELCIAVLDALDHAHDNQIVHRDIKPANVMLAHSGAVKVMDFGIARMLGRNRQTQFGHAVGTPTYMAPEQLRGEEVDRRTDVYAVGAVLFELITGRLPFEADSDYRLMMLQLHEPPPRPSTMQPDVPAELDETIARSMAKDRADRFRDAVSFSRELRSILDAHADSRARTPASETRLLAPVAEVAADGIGKTTDHTLAGETRVAGGAGDAGETRVAGADVAPKTRVSYAGEGSSGAPGYEHYRDGTPGYVSTVAGTVQRVLANLEPWQKDWRTWSAAGALLVAAGLSAIGLRSYGEHEDDGPAVQVADGSGLIHDVSKNPSGPSDPNQRPSDVGRRGDMAIQPVTEDAASLIINAPPIRPSVPPQPEPERPKGSGGAGDRREAPAPEPRQPAPDRPPQPKERDSTSPRPQPESGGRVEPVKPEVQTEAEAHAEISSLLGQAARQLSGRDGGVAQSLIGGAKGGEWSALMREGRVSMSIDGSPGVRVDGDRARADVSATVNVRSAFGANRRRSAQFSAELERSGGRWVLRVLRPVGELELM